jgi:hypothetical protein
VERFFNTNIKAIQFDWGGEYRPVNKLLQQLGILHRVSCPHTHQQNGAIEQKHRHIVETGLALLSHAHLPLPLPFWDDAFSTACYLINRMPTTILQNQSPFEVLFKCSPDYSFLKTFGCLCWSNLRPYNTNKFQPRSVQRLQIFYIFPEMLSSSSLPFHILLHSQAKLHLQIPGKHSPCLFFLFHWLPQFHNQALPLYLLLLLHCPLLCSPLNPNQSHLWNLPLFLFPEVSSPPSTPLESVHPMVTRAKNNISKPREFTDGRVWYPIPRALLAESSSLITEPTCHSSAIKDKNWRAAMNTKFDALLQNRTWTLVPPNSATNVIGCKWVFQLKRKADGSIDRYKARLVAKGFHQQPGID